MCIHNPLFFYCFLLLQQSDISCSLAPPCLNHLIHPAFLMRAKVRNIALVSSLFNPCYFTLRYLHLSTFFLPLALFHLSRTHAYCLGKFHTLRQPHTHGKKRTLDPIRRPSLPDCGERERGSLLRWGVNSSGLVNGNDKDKRRQHDHQDKTSEGEKRNRCIWASIVVEGIGPDLLNPGDLSWNYLQFQSKTRISDSNIVRVLQT